MSLALKTVILKKRGKVSGTDPSVMLLPAPAEQKPDTVWKGRMRECETSRKEDWKRQQLRN